MIGFHQCLDQISGGARLGVGRGVGVQEMDDEFPVGAVLGMLPGRGEVGEEAEGMAPVVHDQQSRAAKVIHDKRILVYPLHEQNRIGGGSRSGSGSTTVLAPPHILSLADDVWTDGLPVARSQDVIFALHKNVNEAVDEAPLVEGKHVAIPGTLAHLLPSPRVVLRVVRDGQVSGQPSV